MNMKINTLYYGDCLEVMRPWPDASVDLIYLDPPFNSKVHYNVLFGAGKHERKEDLAQMTAFSDVWEWDIAAEQRVANIERAIAHPAHAAICAFRILYPHGSGMLSYLSYMAERIAEMKRLLKPSGGIFLHCDPTADYHLRIIMDTVFGGRNFRNQIIWCYTGPGSPNMRQFNRKHDVIFWYGAGSAWTFNADAVRVPYIDAKQSLRKRMGEKFDDPGEIQKYRERGKIPETWWRMRIAPRSKKEYLGYPTQKPIALLERIIAAASNPGDLVLDPFCGCGTTIDAAHRLRRNWI
ncbi:MAG: site-specific DNA-methyltransferase, partial [Gammaproteobacteria bacterium]